MSRICVFVQFRCCMVVHLVLRSLVVCMYTQAFVFIVSRLRMHVCVCVRFCCVLVLRVSGPRLCLLCVYDFLLFCSGCVCESASLLFFLPPP